MSGIQWNEISSKSFGGTELMARRIESSLPKELLDEVQIILSRVRELDGSKIRILVCNDLPGDPESHHLRNGGWAKFHKIVFVSHWQKEWYVREYQIPYSHVVVLQNAIIPIEQNTIIKPDPNKLLNLVYHTTPHRGLDILYTVINELVKEYPQIHLDVYSSFKIYGWEKRDEEFTDLFNRISNHPNMTNHGYVPNDQIRKTLGKTHIFGYPNTWMETSCLSMMEAMSAKCSCVHPDFGALPETTANWTFQYPFNEDKNQHAIVFYAAMKTQIEELLANKPSFDLKLVGAKNYVDIFNNWSLAQTKWKMLLESLIKNVKDRSLVQPTETFVYRSV